LQLAYPKADYVSQGSVRTRSWCDGIFDHVIANLGLPLSVSGKNCEHMWLTFGAVTTTS